MKKFFMALFLLILFSLVLNSCKTFDGYYYDLEEARSQKKFYQNSDYLFTKDLDETIVDFVVKEHVLHIVEIEFCTEKENTKYRVKHSSSYALEEAIYRFEQFNDYHWIKTSNLSLNTFSWCIVSKDFNSKNDNFSSFEFAYKDISYCLCYNMNT